MATCRKGDLIIVEHTTHDYVIGQGRTERVEFRVGVVASATRDGVAKSWFDIGWGDELLSGYAQPVRSGDRARVVSAKEIDVPAVLAAAKEHHWPGHPGQPMPFGSLDEVRDLARPFRLLAA